MVDAHEQIEKFQDFIDSEYKKELNKIINKGLRSLVVDFNDIAEFDHVLAEQLLEEPEDSIRAAEIALDNLGLGGKSIKFRVKNLPKAQMTLIRNIRSNHLNKLISFEGIVRQSSDVRPQVTQARFECPSCGDIITILQVDTSFKEPRRCSCGRKGKFRLLSKDLVDAQRLVIEESPELLEGGEQPKRLSVFLKEDLVEPKMERKTTPGSKIKITGIIKEIPVYLRTGAQSIRYDLIAETNYIEPVQETLEDIEISEEDEDAIKSLAKDPKIYEKLVMSVAPSIWGHEKIKEALILQLMGGVRKVRDDGTKTRGDMHILLVGDPGSGKSQLLQFISKAAPRARFVSGKGASSAGLTASVVRDEFLKGWALEAGALILANSGILCIDEMDKIPQEDTSALHEALEQQTVTIAKANIQAVLRAETAVLAAANPKLGRFDPYKPIPDQIDMPPTLINRFDLIFPIRDLPNKEIDEKIAKHILKIQKEPTKVQSIIPRDLLKKYIAYVKQKVHPKLTDAAIEEIKNFYVELRNQGSFGDDAIKPIPITARQLEALVRLAEGNARIRLGKQITKADARRAINILRYCLEIVGLDPETGKIDIDRISTGITASQRSKIVIIREIIYDLEESIGKSIPLEEIINNAAEKGIQQEQVEEVIERLKREGEVFEPRRGFVSRI